MQGSFDATHNLGYQPSTNQGIKPLVRYTIGYINNKIKFPTLKRSKKESDLVELTELNIANRK